MVAFLRGGTTCVRNYCTWGGQIREYLLKSGRSERCTTSLWVLSFPGGSAVPLELAMHKMRRAQAPGRGRESGLPADRVLLGRLSPQGT